MKLIKKYKYLTAFPNNQKGQALFEMILFLPFLLFLYTIFYSAGNSISGSINQQKAVRGYFYNLVKGNSYLLTSSDLQGFKDKGLKLIGFNAIGFNSHLGSGTVSYAPCFRFSSLLKNGSTEDCDGSTRDEQGSSRFIRLYTFYGVCGPAYFSVQDSQGKDFFEINPSIQSAAGSCALTNH